MSSLQQIYEQILSSNLINFLIVIFTLRLIFKKCNLGSIIDDMAASTKEKVEKSASDTKLALEEYKKIKRSAKDTPKLQKEILDNAKNNAIAIKEQQQQKTNIQKEQISKQNEKALLNQAQKFKKLTTDEIYLSCVNIARDEVIKRLDDATQRKLIDISINEISEIEGNLF